MKTLNQVRKEGISVLAKSLGPVDAIRFLQQFDLGHGDYTAERHHILGNPTVDEIVKKIKARRRRMAGSHALAAGSPAHRVLV